MAIKIRDLPKRTLFETEKLPVFFMDPERSTWSDLRSRAPDRVNLRLLDLAALCEATQEDVVVFVAAQVEQYGDWSAFLEKAAQLSATIHLAASDVAFVQRLQQRADTPD